PFCNRHELLRRPIASQLRFNRALAGVDENLGKRRRADGAAIDHDLGPVDVDGHRQRTDLRACLREDLLETRTLLRLARAGEVTKRTPAAPGRAPPLPGLGFGDAEVAGNVPRLTGFPGSAIRGLRIGPPVLLREGVAFPEELIGLITRSRRRPS